LTVHVQNNFLLQCFERSLFNLITSLFISISTNYIIIHYCNNMKYIHTVRFIYNNVTKLYLILSIKTPELTYTLFSTTDNNFTVLMFLKINTQIIVHSIGLPFF